MQLQYNDAATAAPAATVSPAFHMAPLRSLRVNGAAALVPYGADVYPVGGLARVAAVPSV